MDATGICIPSNVCFARSLLVCWIRVETTVGTLFTRGRVIGVVRVLTVKDCLMCMGVRRCWMLSLRVMELKLRIWRKAWFLLRKR